MAEASELFGRQKSILRKLEEMAENRQQKTGLSPGSRVFHKRNNSPDICGQGDLEVTGGHRNDLTAGHIKQVQRAL